MEGTAYKKHTFKTDWDINPTLLSQMNSWLLNAVYFSQVGCCNSEILLFSQDKLRYQLCHFSLNVIPAIYQVKTQYLHFIYDAN